MANKIIFPIGYYPDPTKAGPVALGKVYIGTADTDPTVVGNQKVVSALQESGTTVGIAQPIRLSAGGTPVYDGSDATLFVDGTFSMTVTDADDVVEYTFPNATSFAESISTVTGDNVDNTDTENPIVLTGEVLAEKYGVVGDGVTDDTVAIQACESSSDDNFNLYGKDVLTTLDPDVLTKNYFNGNLTTVQANKSADMLYPNKVVTKDSELERNRTKSRILTYEDKNFLWLGTSIPHQGTDVDSYPTLTADSLNANCDNMSWSGSHAFWDNTGDVNAVPTIAALSMTEYDRDLFATANPGSMYDDADTITKASQMTCDYRIKDKFAVTAYDVVVLDHNHNDRSEDLGELNPTGLAIASVAIGATTVFTMSSVTGLAENDSVILDITGIAKLADAACNITDITGSDVTVNINSTGYAGSFSSGTMTKVDKATTFGAFNFLISYIKNMTVLYSATTDIVLCGSPSEYTGDSYDPAIYANSQAIKQLADKWELAFYDVGYDYGITAEDHLIYFPDTIHPSTNTTRQSLSRFWVRWLTSGALPLVNDSLLLTRGGSDVHYREAIYSKYDLGYGCRNYLYIQDAPAVLDDDFSGGLGAWTITGTVTNPADPWGGGGDSALCDSTAGSLSLLKYTAGTALGLDPDCQFDLYLPEVSGQAPAGTIKTIDILRLQPIGGTVAYVVQLLISSTGITPKLVYFKSPSTDIVTLPAIDFPFAKDTKYTLKLEIIKETASGAGDGSILFSIDGVDVSVNTGVETFSQTAITDTQIGIIASNTTQDFDLYLGNVLGYTKTAKDFTNRFTGTFTDGAAATVTVVNGIIQTVV